MSIQCPTFTRVLRLRLKGIPVLSRVSGQQAEGGEDVNSGLK